MWGRYSCCRNRLFFIFTAGWVEGFFEKRRFDYFFVDLLKIEHLDGRMKDEKFLSAATKVTAWLRNQSQKYGVRGLLLCVRQFVFVVCAVCVSIYLLSLLLFQLSYSISESFAFLISVERSSFLR